MCKRSPLVPPSIPFRWLVFILFAVSVLTFGLGQVHHALLYTVTRTLELPSDKKSANFSKTNWGDHILVTPRGERVVKHASVFLNKISTLKDQQWDNILERALAFQSSFRKQHATAREVDMRDSALAGEVVVSESDDNDLLDPRYDMI